MLLLPLWRQKKLQAGIQDKKSLIKHAINDICKLLQKNEPSKVTEKICLEFPLLQSNDTQMALVDLVIKCQHVDVVQKVLFPDIDKGTVSKDIGVKVLVEALKSHISPEDLTLVVNSLEISEVKAKQTWQTLESNLADLKHQQVIKMCMDLSIWYSFINFLHKHRMSKSKILKAEIGQNPQRNM